MKKPFKFPSYKYVLPLLFILLLVSYKNKAVFGTVILDESSSTVETNAKQYKIRFHVTDLYGNNLDGFRFKVFSTYDSAAKAIDEMNNNTFVGYTNVLTSEKGIVLSTDDYQENKDYYMVSLTKKDTYQYYETIVTFRLGPDDHLLTENIRDGAHTYTIKEILSVQMKNKMKIQWKTVDDYGNPVNGVQYALFGNEAQAEAARQFFSEHGTGKGIKNALEIIAPSDSFGTALSKKYYAPGTYYLVQYWNGANPQFEPQHQVIQVPIGEDRQSLHKMDGAESDGYFNTIPEAWTQVEAKYKIRMVEQSDKNGVYGLFQNQEGFDHFKTTGEASDILEKIKISDGIGETDGFYPAGTYIISSISNTEEKENIVTIQASDRQDIEKGYDPQQGNYYYVKNSYTASGVYSAHTEVGNEPVRMPLAAPDRLPVRSDAEFMAYKNIFENQYSIFDENSIPIGYVVLQAGEDIQNYDVMGNLHPYEIATAKTNRAMALSNTPVEERKNPTTGTPLFYTIGWVVLFAGIYLYTTQRLGRSLKNMLVAGNATKRNWRK